MMKSTRVLSLLAWTVVGAAPAIAADPLDFNRDIRPILAENCFYCHGQDSNHRQAELRLDVRESAIESGAITPHNTAASSLIERIESNDPELQMPRRNRTASYRPNKKRHLHVGSPKGRLIRRIGLS